MNISHHFKIYMNFLNDNPHCYFLIMVVFGIFYYRANKKRKDLKSSMTAAKDFTNVANKLELQHRRLLYAIMKSVSDMKYLTERFSIIGDSEANSFIQFSGDVLNCVYSKDIPESIKINQLVYHLENNFKPVYAEYMMKYLEEADIK